MGEHFFLVTFRVCNKVCRLEQMWGTSFVAKVANKTEATLLFDRLIKIDHLLIALQHFNANYYYQKMRGVHDYFVTKKAGRISTSFNS